MTDNRQALRDLSRRGFFATIAAAVAAPAAVKAVPPILAHRPITQEFRFSDAEMEEFSEMYIRPALEASAKAAANEWDRLAVEQQRDREFALGDRWQA